MVFLGGKKNMVSYQILPYLTHCYRPGDGPGAAGPEAATSLLERLCSEYKEQMAQLDKARNTQC